MGKASGTDGTPWRAEEEAGRLSLVGGLVHRMAGEAPLRCRRSPGTGGRETYQVDTARRSFIVRLSGLPPAASRCEAAVLEACRSHGLPVASILHIGAAGCSGLHAAIQERLPGEPLDPAWFAPGCPGFAGLVEASGRLLARLHGIATSGYGPLVGRLRGAFPLWKQVIDLWRPALRSGGVEPFRTLGLRPVDMEPRMRLLADLTAQAPPRMLHGDFKLDHVLVDQGVVSGLLDLECALSGDPLWDLARWSTFNPAANIWERFLAGYGAALPGDLHLRLALYRIRQSVEISLHALATGNQGRLAQLARNLDQDLRTTA